MSKEKKILIVSGGLGKSQRPKLIKSERQIRLSKINGMKVTGFPLMNVNVLIKRKTNGIKVLSVNRKLLDKLKPIL